MTTAILIDILLIIGSMAIVLKGADLLTEGSTIVARRFSMPEMLIGMTIVAFGTSMPEFCVSMASAIGGTSDMAVGNVVGSNVFNMFLIIGICSLIHPMSVPMDTIKRDLPFAFIATLLFIAMLYDGILARWEGAVMLVAFAAFMFYSMNRAMKGNMGKEAKEKDYDNEESVKKGGLFHSPWLTIPLGLFFLTVGSDVFVDNASGLAKQLGISEAVIGLTILGGGTSMPELATSAVAAVKGRTSMALGNVIGSCIFNILLILGATSAMMPLQPDGITSLDLGMLFVGALLIWFFSFTKRTMERWEGGVLALLFFIYIGYLIYTL